MTNCNHEEEHAFAAARAKMNMPKEEEIVSLATAFKAISEPSRLKILFALRQGEMCVYHITEAVGSTQSAVSHQLKILKDNKIVKARSNGKQVMYSVSDGHVMTMISVAKEHLGCDE